MRYVFVSKELIVVPDRKTVSVRYELAPTRGKTYRNPKPDSRRDRHRKASGTYQANRWS